MNVFIDEAGDLGFSKGSTRFFIVAYFIPDAPWSIRHALNRFHQKINKSGTINELHFIDSNEQCRIGCFNRLANHLWETGIIVLDKNTVKGNLIGKTDILYNYSILHFMFRSILRDYDPAYSMNIKIDRGMDRTRRNLFNEYGAEKAEFIWRKMYRNRGSILSKINIEHDHSFNDYCLQFADFLASATFQLYENKKYQYFLKFKGKIRDINYLFKK